MIAAVSERDIGTPTSDCAYAESATPSAHQPPSVVPEIAARQRTRSGRSATSYTRTCPLQSPTAIRRGKYAMRALASMSFDQGIAYTESQIALLAMTQDAKEGLAAFAEKRKPVWTGK